MILTVLNEYTVKMMSKDYYILKYGNLHCNGMDRFINIQRDEVRNELGLLMILYKYDYNNTYKVRDLTTHLEFTMK